MKRNKIKKVLNFLVTKLLLTVSIIFFLISITLEILSNKSMEIYRYLYYKNILLSERFISENIFFTSKLLLVLFIFITIIFLKLSKDKIELIIILIFKIILLVIIFLYSKLELINLNMIILSLLSILMTLIFRLIITKLYEILRDLS